MKLSEYTHISRSIILISCSIILAALLIGCSGSSTTSTPTPKLTTYKGDGYTIGYPQGWNVTSSLGNIVFYDSTKTYHVTINVVANPNGAFSADTSVSGLMNVLEAMLKNPKTVNVPSPVTIDGDSWVQKSLTATDNTSGHNLNVQDVIASANHPANSTSTRSFTIAYGAIQSSFDAGNSNYFQPMIQSFKFTS